jgi:hypothetical protein
MFVDANALTFGGSLCCGGWYYLVTRLLLFRWTTLPLLLTLAVAVWLLTLLRLLPVPVGLWRHFGWFTLRWFAPFWLRGTFVLVPFNYGYIIRFAATLLVGVPRCVLGVVPLRYHPLLDGTGL